MVNYAPAYLVSFGAACAARQPSGRPFGYCGTSVVSGGLQQVQSITSFIGGWARASTAARAAGVDGDGKYAGLSRRRAVDDLGAERGGDREPARVLVQVGDSRRAEGDGESADAVASWVELAAAELEASSWADGCPVATVTLETAHTSAVLAEACQAALGSWRAAITEAIAARGIASTDALRLATLVLAGIEGGLLLARAYRSSEPLRAAGDELAAILQARVPDASRP
jgi:hypothetical protein